MNRFLLRIAVTGLAVGSLAVLVSTSEAQDKLQPREGEEAVLGGMQDKLLAPERRRWDDLRSGKKSVSEDPKPNQEVIAKSARWYAYRLTMPRFHGLEAASGPIQQSMTDLIREVTDPLLLSTFRSHPRRPGQPNANQLEYVKAFTQELTKCLRDVLSRNSKPIVRVNAARMLALVAETEQEEVADTLVALLRNPRESDGVKFWALRGLKNIGASATGERPAYKDAKREARVLQALQAYIARKPELPTDTQEVEALRYVRREAIRALSQSHLATIPGTKDKAGQISWWLVKVARKDGLVPEPSIAEQMEAATGACQLKYNKDLQLDYVAYHVGGVVVDFLNHYNRAMLGGGETNIPWKLYAVQLVMALEQLKAQAKNAPGKTGAYVDKVVEQITTALKPLDQKNANPDPTALDNWLRKNPPAGTSVYKSIPDSTVKVPEGAGT